ncbi:ATP-binding cassette domain-containing protein [Bacillus sp. HMF5848]|uniref:ABC transporter ATP-binding protein n=1 Tax=Bacillus sp. HMF5848 TaxID=2495421 RepID=UPI000F7A4898|nr:ABC transporter transmembrane domain-containing protein [Bacillus sp. HMF5848]RSK26288.1 ATP-binding cassette domain-containing protein [Bacillus sp. HMF5848]
MFEVLGKLSWFFKEHWKKYVIAISLLAFGGILEMFPPRLVGQAIDYINTGNLTSAVMVQLAVSLVVLTVLTYVVNFVWIRNLFGASFVLERTLRSKFMAHLIKMTPTFYQKNRTGDLMARATNDLRAVGQTAGFGILTLVDSSMFLLVIVIAMAATISWQLTLAAILPMPILAILVHKYGKMLHERFTVAQDAFGDVNDYVLESIAGVRVNRAYVQEKADEARFHEMTEDVYDKNEKVVRIDALFEPTVKILVGLSYVIGLGYGAYLVFNQTITLGELVTFNVYLGMLIWPMFAIGELINVMERGNASLDRVNETLSYKPDVENHVEPLHVEVPDSIEYKHVTFRYPSSEVENLHDVSMSLHRGQTLGIVGKTGAGKTTFVKQLLREFPTGKGDIRIAGTPIERIPLEQLQGWIGYVPQDHVLFSRTVKENIRFGKKDATEHELNKAIDLADFRKDLENLPEGLATIVGEKGVSLSGGQKQRISIARALLVNPEILILDDSLSAVDAKTEHKIIENIRKERSDKTTIITTHRLSAVEHADWIIVLEDGRIIEEGTHPVLLAKNGWYKEQYIRQQVEAIEESGVLL